ncbi:MAG: MFS transporter [Proteobacteria bacterium]|nr:MFS transporter [Pseudomonadota bacterium]MBU4472037.1 MFS transporter [Pseudomonadota bacterium]MCG2752964.1 MFS transporter [Desulfobacteraceae bacterium]
MLKSKRKTENPSEDPSLKAAVKDGVSYAVMMGAGETYLGPFGIFLQATTLQVGLLATVPQLFGAIMQFVGAKMMPRFKSRRRTVFIGVMAQAFFWIPMLLLPFFCGTGGLAVFLLILFSSGYHGANGAVLPVWNSLIGDLVPFEIRGRFFGNRNRLTGIATFISVLAAGILLDVFDKIDLTSTGYLCIFVVAFLARVNSGRWVAKYDDPEFRMLPDQFFTFRQFLRRSPKSNFAKFVFYVGAIRLCVAFSAPYFALYMLRDLKFSYLEFTLVTAASVIVQFLTFRYWGELSDRFGNKKILNLCGWGVVLAPVFWLFSSNILYILAIQTYSGFVWAGFTLASANFIFDAVSPPKRALCVAYQGLIHGVCIFVGSIAGGYTAAILPATYVLGPFSWAPASVLLVIFLLSGIFRLVVSCFLIRKFKEVRDVESIGNRELFFRVAHIKPIAGFTFNLFTGILRDPSKKRDPRKKDR